MTVNQRFRTSARSVTAIAAVFCFSLPALAEGIPPGCGYIGDGYGPFDYRVPENRSTPDRIPVVEKHHLTENVLSLKSGATGSVLQDLYYTLRAVPNHHQALFALANYVAQGRPIEPPGLMRPDCFFARAKAFAPDDPAVYSVHGYLLYRQGQRRGAVAMYEKAVEIDANSAEAHYNLGLLYLDLGDVAKARVHADRAYALGYPLPGLKNRLRQADKADKRSESVR